jgi:hypothetical protein
MMNTADPAMVDFYAGIVSMMIISRRNTRMKYRVNITRSYKVASFDFNTIVDASNFANVAAEHIQADDDGREFKIIIEIIKEGYDADSDSE